LREKKDCVRRLRRMVHSKPQKSSQPNRAAHVMALAAEVGIIASDSAISVASKLI
jgi:hypothetical protein